MGEERPAVRYSPHEHADQCLRRDDPEPGSHEVRGGPPLDRWQCPGRIHIKADCAGHSSSAEELFNFPFVTGVFISGTFVSVTKDDSLGWEMIAMQMREYIQQWLTEHPTAVEKVPPPTAVAPVPEATPTAGEPVVALADDDIVPTEHDQAIADLLEEFVRPAVEADCGAIDFRAFINGTVHVRLRGACAGCPSSTATLKDGIERLLTSQTRRGPIHRGLDLRCRIPPASDRN